MFCTNCGHEVQGKFCTNCGTPVAEAAPAAETPVQEAPVYEAPVQETPVQQAPVYEAPQAPVYEAPAAPTYEAPAQQYAAPQQTYAAPAPAKEKKGMSAGKIVLIVLLSVLAAIILLVAACSIFVGRAANNVANNFESTFTSESDYTFDEAEDEDSAAVTNEFVYYEGLTYIRVDNAYYTSDGIVADITFKNDMEVGLGQISDLMLYLYDAESDMIAYGNFYFDAPMDCYLAPGATYSTTVTFNSDSGDYVEGGVMDSCSVSYEMMAHMYDDEDQIIGERVVTRMFEMSLPAEWVGKVDYYLPDSGYGFYSIANDRAGADGTLFTIEYHEPGTYTGDGEYLGEDSWYEYYVTYPAGTAYDTSDSELAAEYELFESQIEYALHTVHIF